MCFYSECMYLQLNFLFFKYQNTVEKYPKASFLSIKTDLINSRT